MEDAETQIAISTYQKRELRKTHQKPHMGNAINDSLPDLGRRRSRRKPRDFVKIHRKNAKRSNNSNSSSRSNISGSGSGAGAGEEDEKEEVERKIQALQRIVPGGESLGVDKLFEETAGYIMALQCQLKAMRTLASFFEGLEKEKRKFGG
ncbi:hypothetical protein PanWU01x14_088910 [Parasponia andersonii]|uniref:Myc-type, basic helix-loop-helix (BHLH) domain containing protein n=1 Tax=Parasponia andersonii TaxID=3476 RepID=A0A2P5D811_PARAD|nr:hypothetical protein PanWU01x14_088910 [Parasponia andersonii]